MWKKERFIKRFCYSDSTDQTAHNCAGTDSFEKEKSSTKHILGVSLFQNVSQKIKKIPDEPDEACWDEALYGFSWNLVEFHIPLVIWYVQDVEFYKLTHTQRQ